jgi:hypothetical protein
MTDKPTPGSDAALLMGCTCPVMDNHHGHGFAVEGELVFWIDGECPMHGEPTQKVEDD